jgi:thiol-disulfide isomerase/thioredoxin
MTEDGHLDGAGRQEAEVPTGPGIRMARSAPEPEVRIGWPGWAPFAFVVVFAVGIGFGVLLTAFLDDGDSAAAAPPATTATTTMAAAPSTTVAGDASPVAPPATTPGDPSDPEAYGDVEIEGAVLPQLVSGSPDAAVGMPAPAMSGADFSGTRVSLEADGNAKLVLFVAHWCPYCRDELPLVRDWLDATELPENVDFYSVSTFVDPARPNYPPRAWFEQEAWDVPLIVDDAADTAARTYGVNAVPFWLLVHTDNTVAARGAGALTTEVLDQIVADLAQGPDRQ